MNSGKISLFQVDAFTDRLFSGNPAAVCPLEQWLPAEVMQSIAAENNLSETAFFVRCPGGYELRWFTPATEVDLCGHATLAATFVIFKFLVEKKALYAFAPSAASAPFPSRIEHAKECRTENKIS